MDYIRNDVRHALRALSRNRSFALAAILTLALGIGATTAIFSVVDGVLFRPLPYTHPERLMVLWNNNTREGIERDITSYANFLDWRARGAVFVSVAAYTGEHASVREGREPAEAARACVHRDFVETLGVPAIRRRGLGGDDARGGR